MELILILFLILIFIMCNCNIFKGGNKKNLVNNILNKSSKNKIKKFTLNDFKNKLFNNKYKINNVVKLKNLNVMGIIINDKLKEKQKYLIELIDNKKKYEEYEMNLDFIANDLKSYYDLIEKKNIENILKPLSNKFKNFVNDPDWLNIKIKFNKNSTMYDLNEIIYNNRNKYLNLTEDQDNDLKVTYNNNLDEINTDLSDNLKKFKRQQIKSTIINNIKADKMKNIKISNNFSLSEFIIHFYKLYKSYNIINNSKIKLNNTLCSNLINNKNSICQFSENNCKNKLIKEARQIKEKAIKKLETAESTLKYIQEI